MTLVLGKSGGLEQIQLGINEVASAFIVGKLVGTVFTRSQDALIFGILEKQYGVYMKGLPEWMKPFQFSRTGVIHVTNMQPRELSGLMGDVDVHSLQGFATIIVLCCRYTESIENIVRIIEDFISRGHSALYSGKLGDWNIRLPVPMKALLSNFVRATIDSDSKSWQFNQVMEWMGVLAKDVGVSTKLKFPPRRSYEYNRALIAKLTGNNINVSDSGNPRDLVVSGHQRVERGQSRAYYQQVVYHDL